MTRKRWLVAAVAAGLAAGAGCASCRPEAVALALEAGPSCPVPAWERQRVYAFLVNGVSPVGLCGLRDGLNREGFAKVADGQMVHAGWMADEMRRVAADDPDARFVVVGYDLGAGLAAGLAGQAKADGLAVDALVLLDPVGHSAAGPPVRTVVVCSRAAAPAGPHTESYAVPDAGHFRLPGNPTTVGIVAKLLHESAARVARPLPEPEAADAYEHAPAARPAPTAAPGASPDWAFLHDAPGSHTTPLSPVHAPAAAARPAPSAPAAAQPVPAWPVSTPRAP